MTTVASASRSMPARGLAAHAVTRIPRSWTVALVVVALVLAVGVAFLTSNYHLFQLTLVATYAIAILGLNIVTGFNGQISLGHGAFYAIGAYVTAIMMSLWDTPYWATLPVAMAVSALAGFLIGFPALRLGGLYLALTTFALAVATPQLLKYKAIEAWTGGVQGIVITKPDAPFGLPLSGDQWLYLFTLGILILAFVAAWNILRGRVGRQMRAIRDHALAAEAMGINIAQLKTRTFALAAMFTGLAGGLAAIAIQFVAPDTFSITLSIWLFVGMIVGGVASLSGPIIGGLFVVFIPNIASGISKAAPDAIYGVILIAVMCLVPSGVAGGITHLARRLAARGDPAHEPVVEVPDFAGTTTTPQEPTSAI